MKILYSTDWHAKGKNPGCRTDDYPTTIEEKIVEFFQTGIEMQVDAYMVGGDFVDSSYSSAQYINRLGKVIEDNLEKTGKKLYYILGNHDLIAYTPSSIDTTTFGIFLRFVKNMVRLSREPIALESNGQTVYLTGVDSHVFMDRDQYEDGQLIKPSYMDWVVPVKMDHPIIHVAHGFLSPKKLMDAIPHTTIEQMRHTYATVTLGSHDHSGFDITPTDHGLAFNPGALGRVFASHNEMERMPKWTLVTIHKDGTPEIKTFPVKAARPGNLVMDRSKIEKKMEQLKMMAEHKSVMQQVMANINIKSASLHSIVAEFKDQWPPDVYAEVIQRLEL